MVDIMVLQYCNMAHNIILWHMAIPCYTVVPVCYTGIVRNDIPCTFGSIVPWCSGMKQQIWTLTS